MAKIAIDENAFPYPMPMVLLGTMVDGRPNFMAAAWVTRVNYQPPLIAVALGKSHYTNGGIHASKAFSINIPGLALLDKTDCCGLVSGKMKDKAGLFSVTLGEKTGAPLIGECPVHMECKLATVVDLPSNELFVGEIVGAYADAACCSGGKPDIERLNPFTLTMPDNRYWEVGRCAGKAWDAGKKIL